MAARILTDGLDIALARASLYEFIKYGWEELEPGTPFVDGWHIRVVADEAQKVLEDWEECARRTRVTPAVAQDTVINVPPGTMKTLIVSVFAPAWMWLRCPWWRAIYASGNPRTMVKSSTLCRDLIDSDWYQQSFHPEWTWANDQNAKTYYKNTMGGFRQSISVGQKVTGDRADFLGVDDPLDATDSESNSKVARDAVLFWWDQAFYNRVNDSVRSKRLVIMQRLHEDDLAGHLKKAGTASFLVLPMEYDPKRPDPRDIRTTAGELLFPARFPPEVLVAERKRLGSWGYAGQHQQDPVPAGGGMFPREWWRFWTQGTQKTAGPRPEGCTALPPKRLPEFSMLTMSVDANFKEGPTSDFVAITVWGCSGPDHFLLYCWRDRCGMNGTLKAIREALRLFPDITRTLVEEAANGAAIIETLRAEVSGVIAIKPEGGKEARAAACQPTIEAGNVYLPEGAPYLEDYLTEFTKFPKGSNDDMVDSTTQYLNDAQNSDVRRLEMLSQM